MKIKMCIVVLIGMIVTTNSFSQNIPSYVPKNGLIGWWPFNGNANDESGNGNNGEIINDLNGNVKFINNEKGVQNSAIEFSSIDKSWNAKSSYIKIPNTPSLSIINGYTINLFVKISKNNQTGELINKGPDNQNCFFSRMNGNKNILFGSIPKYLDKNIDLDTTKWIMLTMVKNTENDSSYLFVDGIKVSSSINAKSTNNNYDFWFGLHQYGSNGSMYPYQGKMDDVSMWNRPLSPNEIQKIKTACQKQTATTSSLDKIILTNSSKFSMNVIPGGGTLYGISVINNQIDPSKSKLGRNNIDYFFKNETGCNDSTRFTYTVYDTLGITCTKTDTVKITKTTYDTIVTKTSVTDTLKIKIGLTTGLYANQVNLIKIFPNPTASDLVIDFGNQEMIKGYTLTINDLSGKQVYKENIQTQKSIIKLSTLGSKGIYKINMMNDNNILIDSRSIVLE
jgi:hypothetical protein